METTLLTIVDVVRTVTCLYAVVRTSRTRFVLFRATNRVQVASFHSNAMSTENPSYVQVQRNRKQKGLRQSRKLVYVVRTCVRSGTLNVL